jgi:hypothetical protein
MPTVGSEAAPASWLMAMSISSNSGKCYVVDA